MQAALRLLPEQWKSNTGDDGGFRDSLKTQPSPSGGYFGKIESKIGTLKLRRPQISKTTAKD